MPNSAHGALALSLAFILAGTSAVHSQDAEILLDMLQKRGVINNKDAGEVRAELAKKKEERVDVDSAASKLKLSDSVTEMKIFGEARLRYFVNEAEAAGLDAGDHGQRDRFRYRLRLGSDLKLHDGWSAGFLLETNNSARSANVTLGENPVFSKATISKDSSFINGVTTTDGPVVTGFDSKTGKLTTGTAVKSVDLKKGSVVSNVNFGDTLFVGRAYLKYQPADWVTLTGGKIANPFVTTRMVWDPDINPEGLAEQFKWTFSGDAPAGLSKDGKAVAPAHEGMSVDLFANFAQFIYDDVGFENNFNTGTDPFTAVPNSTDRWMLGWQLGAMVHFNPTTSFQVAPAFYNYTGGGSGSAGPFNGDNALVILDKNADPKLITFNQTGTNDLAFLEVPAELRFKLGNLPAAIFGDFAYNFTGDARAAKAGHSGVGENMAYQVGASIGSAKKKGDWEIRGWWQHSEAYAVDQNIIDDDIFDGRTNMEGFYLQGSYQFTDGVSLIVQYSHGERINNSLGTPGFGALGTAAGFPLQRTNLVYVDLNLKF